MRDLLLRLQITVSRQDISWTWLSLLLMTVSSFAQYLLLRFEAICCTNMKQDILLNDMDDVNHYANLQIRKYDGNI